MNAYLVPPDARGVWISARERLGAVNLAHAVSARCVAVNRHDGARNTRASLALIEPPSSQVVRHAQDAGTNPFGDPCTGDEVADPRPDLHQITGSNAALPRISRRDPQRIGMRDLVQPLDRGARVHERGQTEVRQEIELSLVAPEIAPVDMTWRIRGDCVFRPAPGRERRRVELEPARRSVEPPQSNPIHDGADDGAISQHRVAVFRQNGVRKILVAERTLVATAVRRVGDFEHAVPAHVLQRCETLARGSVRQPWNRMLEHPSVVFVHRDGRAGMVWTFEVTPDAERTIQIDLPAQRHPELRFLPDFSRVRLVSRRDRLAALLSCDA